MPGGSEGHEGTRSLAALLKEELPSAANRRCFTEKMSLKGGQRKDHKRKPGMRLQANANEPNVGDTQAPGEDREKGKEPFLSSFFLSGEIGSAGSVIVLNLGTTPRLG